jgi:hypothetical protein
MKNVILIFLFGVLGSYSLCAQEFIFSTTIDLNNDNETEAVFVENTTNPFEFRLSIGKTEVLGKFDDGELDGFKVIDINKYDKYKEIAVHTAGSSDDDEYMIYWYNGEEIIFMDRLSRWPTFKGNGIVYVDGWVGFWTDRDKYVLDDITRKLKLVEQFAYYVGVTIIVKKGFKIYKEKELINEVALLSKDSEIELILCDKMNQLFYEHKYLIKSKSGLLGWADFKTIEANTTGIQMAD